MSSRKINSPGAYQDVKAVMEMAIKKPGLRYKMKSFGAAINFKQRCGIYRNMLRDMAAETLQHIPGARAETVFDVLVIRQINEGGEPDRRGNVLRFDHQELLGQLIDPDTGEEIHLPGITDTITER